MKKLSWISAPLCAATVLLGALHGANVLAAGMDDLTVGGVKLRGDGTVDDTQPNGANPVQTLQTVTNPDGTTSVIRTRTLSATGEAPARARTMEMTFSADGQLLGQTRTDTRTNAAGVIVRERTRSSDLVNGEMVETRTDIRRDDLGGILRSRERIHRIDRAERLEHLERAERPEMIERMERVERPEAVERMERIGRLEALGRR